MRISEVEIVGRKKPIFSDDIVDHLEKFKELIKSSKFLVIGGAGSIGSSVVKELFKHDPMQLHVVDLSENNLVELVRDLRSSIGYTTGEFKTFAIDCGSIEFQHLFRENNGYDYVLNLSALKHVRSESNKYTLMRMMKVNVLNAITIHELCSDYEVKKYFCVSSDKAANPANLMGASKSLMEKALFNSNSDVAVSMARFANVAFSDGSLLHGFRKRYEKRQPITAPIDITRYFMTEAEAGQLCLFSCLFGNHGEIFFPRDDEEIRLIGFASIAENFLINHGFSVKSFSSEQEARDNASTCIDDGMWPCYFFKTDTTGEKPYEEFYTGNETLDYSRYSDIGVIVPNYENKTDIQKNIKDDFTRLSNNIHWEKSDIVDLVEYYISSFKHHEKNKYLDEKM